MQGRTNARHAGPATQFTLSIEEFDDDRPLIAALAEMAENDTED
jgi:hypothetical protein